METVISLKAARCIEIEELSVAIDSVNSKAPISVISVDRAIEIFALHESDVLASSHDIAEVVVTVVEVLVVSLYRVAVAVSDIVEPRVDSVQEVIVDFVAVIILNGVKIEFVSHTVGKEASVVSHLRGAHRSHCADTSESQGQCKYYSFHSY